MSSRTSVVAIGAAIIASAAGLAACGTGTNGQSSGSSQTLTIQTFSSTEPAIQVVAKKFEAEHPGVKITYSVLSDQSSRGPNISVLSGGGAPDVGFVELSTGVYSTLVKNHDLVDLKPVYTADNLYKEISPDKISYMTGGKADPYGLLMYDAWGSVIFYNESQFAAAGVTPPAGHQFTSMNQFYQVVAKLHAHSDQALGVACGSASDLGHVVDSLLPTASSQATYDSYITDWRRGASGAKYTGQAFTTTLQTISDWASKNVTEPGCLAQTDNSILALFESGKVGMYEGNSYEISSLYGPTKPSFPVGWFMMPPITAGARTPFWDYTGDMLVVPTHSPHKALAEEFVRFFGQESNLVAAAQANAQLPIIAHPTAAEVAGYSPVLKQWIALEQTNGTALVWDAAVPSNIGQVTEVPLLQKMWAGSESVSAFASQEQAALESLQSGKTPVPGL